MAYLDKHRTSNRAAIITTVAALHGVAIYAIVTGLAVNFIKNPIPVFEAVNHEIEKPPPPPPAPRQKKNDDPVVIRETEQRIPLPLPPHQGPMTDPMPIPLPIPDPLPTAAPDPMPLPQPRPSLAARSVRAKGRPADWVTTNDYPARDLREGNQGLARYSLLIGADGRVSSCVVTASSGHPGLDEATCQMVTRRARFEPATDETGARVQGSYSGSVRWVIPQD
jgi:periplasmic protein TonB